MRRCWKYTFYFVTLLLWLTAAAVGLELWTRWQHRAVETGNPFVLSRTQGKEWPIPAEHSNTFSEWLQEELLRTQIRGGSKSVEPLPPVSPRWEMQNRLGLFRELDDWGRQVFANVYGLQILLMQEDATVTKMYPVQHFADAAPLATVLPEELSSRLMNDAKHVFAAPTDILFDSPSEDVAGFQYCIVADPIPDFADNPYFSPSGDSRDLTTPADYINRPDKVWVFLRNPATAAMTAENDLWEAPFFLYRKHVRRKDHVNVLGLAEDFYSNNHGFRDADFPVEKGEGVFRILCVGASTTEEGPTNDLTYPAILETMLNSHFETKRFEVINCGISGMNSLKHRMRSADYLALDPDLIIIYNAVNDICHDLFPIWVKDASPWQKRLRESRFINQYFNRYLQPDLMTMRDHIEQHKMADLRFLAEQAKAQGVQVALCTFAAPDHLRLSAAERDYYEYCTRKEWGGRYVTFDSYLRALLAYNIAIRDLCRDAELIYLPVRLKGGAALFGDICHLRNPGIEAKAKIIAEFLIKNKVVE